MFFFELEKNIFVGTEKKFFFIVSMQKIPIFRMVLKSGRFHASREIGLAFYKKPHLYNLFLEASSYEEPCEKVGRCVDFRGFGHVTPGRSRVAHILKF